MAFKVGFFISYIVFCDLLLQWKASQKNHFDLTILMSDTTAEVDSAFDFDFLLNLTQMQVIALSEMNDGVVVNINGGWNMIKKKWSYELQMINMIITYIIKSIVYEWILR